MNIIQCTMFVAACNSINKKMYSFCGTFNLIFLFYQFNRKLNYIFLVVFHLYFDVIIKLITKQRFEMKNKMKMVQKKIINNHYLLSSYKRNYKEMIQTK